MTNEINPFIRTDDELRFNDKELLQLQKMSSVEQLLVAILVELNIANSNLGDIYGRFDNL